MMGDKILIKQTAPSVFQQVGAQGTRPSFMDFARNTFGQSGQGITPGQRARGLVGMAGKAAAAGVTALNTADSMQQGNVSAPLQAGISYQGYDPTATIDPDVGAKLNQNAQFQNPTPTYDYTQSSYPIHQFVQNPGVSPTGVAVQQPVQPPPTGYGPVATAPTLGQLQQPQPAQAQAQPAQVQVQQGDGSMLNQPQMASIVQQQMNPAGMEQYVPPIDDVTGQQRPVLMPKAFNGMLFDLLGPDNLYKMTPNEIGELAAFMYIKTR